MTGAAGIREIVLDTETTGMEKAADRIIEIGCVEIVDRIPTGRTFHTYCNPHPRRVNPGAYRVHKLSDSFLSRKPVFEDVADELLAFIGDSPLVIHNAPFDVPFLNNEFARLFEPPEPIDLAKVVDTLPLARKALPNLKSKGLDALVAHYKINGTSRADRHGALIDAELLAQVYFRLAGPKQQGLLLDVAPVLAPIADEPVVTGPRPYRSRLTDEERVRHATFVETLGPSAIWNDYIGGAE